MELTAKIFVIIGLIFRAIFIVPLIFGFIALKKMNNCEYSVRWGVLTIIFTSIVGGILLIVLAKKTKE